MAKPSPMICMLSLSLCSFLHPVWGAAGSHLAIVPKEGWDAWVPARSEGTWIDLKAGATRELEVFLEAGRMVQIVFGSQHLDFDVRLLAPSGRELTQTTSFHWNWRPDVDFVVTRESGVYQLRISALEPDALAVRCRDEEPQLSGQELPTGRFRVGIADRPSIPGDQQLVRARRRFSSGVEATACERQEASYRAITDLQSAADVLEALPEPRFTEPVKSMGVEIRYWLGLAAIDLGNLTEAGEQFSAAYELLRGIRLESDTESGALRLGRHQPSELHRDGLSVSDQHRLGDLHYRQGEVHARRSEYWQARDQFDKAKGLFGDLGDRQALGVTHHNLGFVNRQLGRIDDTLHHYLEALEIFTRTGRRHDRLKVLHNLGTTYQVLVGDLATGRTYLAQALDLSRGPGLRGSQPGILSSLAWNLRYEANLRAWNEGDTEAAIALIQQSIAYLEPPECEKKTSGSRDGTGCPHRPAFLLDNLGRSYLARGGLERSQGRTREAESSFQKGLEACLLAHRRELRSGRVSLRQLCVGLAHLALYEIGKGSLHLEEARQWLRRALESSLDQQDRRQVILARFHMARLLQASGKNPEALASLQAALLLVESLRTEVLTPKLRAQYLELHQPLYDMQVELLAQDLDLGLREIEEVFLAHERRRARVALDLLGGNQAMDTSGSTLLDEQRALLAELNALDLEKKLSTQQERKMTAVSERLLRLDTVEAALSRRDPTAVPVSGGILESIEDLQRALDPDTLLLEYSLGNPSSFVFAVTADSIEMFELPARSEIEPLVRNLYTSISGCRLTRCETLLAERTRCRPHHSDSATELAKRLSRIVLGPVLHRLTGGRIVVVPDGGLQRIPFSTLPVPDGRAEGRLLLQDHEVSYSPSASMLVALRRRQSGREIPEGVLAVFADAVFGGLDDNRARFFQLRESARRSLAPWRRLPETAKEALAISRWTDPEKTLVVTGFDATKQRLMETDLGSYRIVHFATHGLSHHCQPQLSGLLLSQVDRGGQRLDGWLRLADLPELNADLVVLSSCDTASGPAIRGEGIMGLSRGFLTSGATSVVASLWPVEDAATARFMESFYRYMFEDGLSPAAALRAVKLATYRGRGSRSESRWASPHIWAAFVVQGDWAVRF